jgi:hypothetical protein
MNERDYPHIVELAVPSDGFRSKSDEILAFHREFGVEVRRGRGATKMVSFMCAIASPILRAPMPSVVDLVAPG